MGRVPRRPAALPPLGDIIWDAMERRTAERGVPYTYTDLTHEILERTGHHRAPPHIRNVVIGERKLPEPEVLADIAAALSPHVSEDLLLIAAGHALPRWPERLRDIAASRSDRTLEDVDADIEEFRRQSAETLERIFTIVRRALAQRRGDGAPRPLPPAG